DKPFTVALWVRPPGAKQPQAVLEKISDAKTRHGFELWFGDPQLIGIQNRAAQIEVRITSEWPRQSLFVRTRERYPRTAWKHFTMTYDGSGKAAGVKLYVDGRPTAAEIVSDTLAGSIGNDADVQIGVKEPGGSSFSGAIDDLRFYNRALAAREIEDIGVHYPIRAVLSGVGGKLSKTEESRLRDYYLRYVAAQSWQDDYAKLQTLQKESAELEKEILTTMVMGRGDYRNHGEKVEPGVPAILPPLRREGKRATRMDLAKWLIDPSHPLTSRVAVNRYWQIYF